MGNVLCVLRRDLTRLVKAPAALAVVLALLILPSAYTWYNVIAFWDPYGHTGNLRVCVVDEDSGATSEITGEIDVGSMIVDELRENDQLAWEFTDRTSAMDELYAGKCYAVFVIPESFTENLLTVVSGNFVQPSLEYYVNEKVGPVSPKITDTGATTLDEQVNETFTATVSDTVVKAIDGLAADASSAFASSQSRAASDIADTMASIAQMRDALDEAASVVSETRESITDANAALSRSKDDLSEAAHACDDVSATVQHASEKLSVISASLGQASGVIAGQAGELEGVAARADELASSLVDTSAGDLSAAIADAAHRAANALQEPSALIGDTIPQITEGLTNLSSAAASLSSAVTDQSVLVDETSLVLAQLDTVLEATGSASSQTSTTLLSLENDLSTVQTDVLALSGSSAFAGLFDGSSLDASRIASFMESPTTVESEELYPLNAYGSAMAPLFMNLTFWIGAFMLVVIMRQEVDGAGVAHLTAAQRYVARFALFVAFAIVQSAVCCTGVLLIGVQTVSAPALFLAAAFASLAYTSIIYALSAVLRHIGKGLCIVAVFAQIPGATGLYPTEMTSSFFQAIYPAFPFTYGIDALREAIFGFYGAHYAADLGALATFFAVFFAFGLVATPLMANVNRLTARQVREGGLFNGENIIAPARSYRFSQLFRALFEKDSYRDELRQRYERFNRRYPKLLRGALVAGVVVPVGLAIVFALTPTEKVTILTVGLVWLVAILVFLVVVENLRASFERQLGLEHIDPMRLVRWGACPDRAMEIDPTSDKTSCANAGKGDGCA